MELSPAAAPGVEVRASRGAAAAPRRRFLAHRWLRRLVVLALALPGLHGVPHLYADDDHDLLFAQGVVHAQGRLWSSAPTPIRGRPPPVRGGEGLVPSRGG